MKKILSFLLAALMLVSMVPTALAADVDVSEGTTIKVVGTGADTYTVTVPAKLAPGESGTVKANGTWPSNQTLNVTAPSSVTLTHGTQTMDVGITFDGIHQAGNDTGSVSAEQTVAVAAASALFGTWTGTLTYTVELVEDSTGGNSSSGDTTCTHVDTDSNGLCDNCGESVESGSGSDSVTYAATFADNSWADIAAACQNNEVPDTWVVGNTKTMTFNGSEFNVTIIGKNHDTYADGSGTAPLTFQTDIVGYAAWNSSGSVAGGWDGSEIYTKLNVTWFEQLDSDIKNNIKAVVKYTNIGYADAGNQKPTTTRESNDKLFLLSSIEVFGEGQDTYTAPTYEMEGYQYDYYAQAEDATAYKNPNAAKSSRWTLRSTSSTSDGSAKAVDESGNSVSKNVEDAAAISFGFCF